MRWVAILGAICAGLVALQILIWERRSGRRRPSTIGRIAFAVLAIVLIGIGWLSHWGGTSFTSSMTSLRVVVVGPLTLAMLGIFLVVERLRPAQRR